MYDYEKLMVLMERVFNKFEQFEKNTSRYSGKVELTHRELHTIAYIGDNPGLNLTTLAKVQGISKSAASQMISRLRKKELVTKQVSANSEAEIVIALTEYGQEAYEAHKQYHASANNEFLNLLAQLPEDTAVQMENILTEFDHALEEWNRREK